ncbi:ABC transporter ATP-binding protein [Aquirhabdus sp.]|uniref:ABC transporter ATP-binding protein n=1 Tax=Aquirhabdus sp. TaxID=2824160 RepID=UPI00396C6A1A
MTNPSLHQPLLQLEGINKSFGGVHALKHVSLSVQQGTIHGLIGPNGAGKTTLFNVMTGMYQADSGRFNFDGESLSLKTSPQVLAVKGLARTFQNIRLFSEMTALENIMVGQHSQTKTGIIGAVLRTPAARREERLIRQEGYRLLEYVGLSKDVADRVARTLSYGDQRRLEIARALALKPRLLALDEPAAGMNPTETAQLQDLIRRLHVDGMTIVLIEHDVGLMMRLCQRISVLDFGEKIADGTPEEIRRDERVIKAYLGGDDMPNSGKGAKLIAETTQGSLQDDHAGTTS